MADDVQSEGKDVPIVAAVISNEEQEIKKLFETVTKLPIHKDILDLICKACAGIINGGEDFVAANIIDGKSFWDIVFSPDNTDCPVMISCRAPKTTYMFRIGRHLDTDKLAIRITQTDSPIAVVLVNTSGLPERIIIWSVKQLLLILKALNDIRNRSRDGKSS